MESNTVANSTARRALVVGLGIAGMATAKRLTEVGWDVTVIERSAERRTGGYFIALFGTGKASAERTGILDRVPTRTGPEAKTWQVARNGRRTPGMGFANIPDAPRVLLRGDIEEALYAVLPEAVEVRYGTVPATITQDPDGVDVTLRSTTGGTEAHERFDLVIGADGVRSTVRRLVFGPDANFVDQTGFMIAATLLDRPVTGYGTNEGAVLAEPGRSAWVFPFDNRPPSILFTYRTDDIDTEFARPAIDSIRAAYGPDAPGPLLDELFDRFEAAEDYLFDSAQQVRMRQWHHGRVGLIGDAAWCMTLYSGLGASSGIAGGELLGTMLERHDHDIPAALAAWNDRLHPYVDYQHRHIATNRQIFVPADKREHLRRSSMMRLSQSRLLQPVLSRLQAGSEDFRMKALDIAAP